MILLLLLKEYILSFPSSTNSGQDQCLYVRQSTLQQVVENTDSTSRQYALRERARALGWPDERILVIARDLGQSGASTADRLGCATIGRPGWAWAGRIGARVGSLSARPQF